MQMTKSFSRDSPAIMEMLTYRKASAAECHLSYFVFDQETVTPADDIFNLFGTVVTGLCAKPAYVLESNKANYYVNVGGQIHHAYTVNLKEMESEESSHFLSVY